MSMTPLKPWEVAVDVPFEEKDEFKKLPGVRYSGSGGQWFRPRDFDVYLPEELAPLVTPSQPLRSYQVRGVENALADKVGYLFNYETGLGKSYAAMGLAEQLDASRILIACPAMVRYHWRDLVTKWGYEPLVWEAGKESPAETTGRTAHIVNYEILGRALRGDYDLLIGDESHRLKNGGRGDLSAAPDCVQHMYTLRDHNRSAFRLLLTATPIANRPIDLWAQLDWLWPGRFGKFWTYAYRYHEVTRSAYGLVIGEPRNSEELRARLLWCSQFVGKAEIPDLPPWSATLEDSWEKRLEQLDSRTWVLTHTRARVEALALRFPQLVAFHGALPARKRHRLIEQAAKDNRPVVSTMHAVREGIDLTHWTTVFYDQLAWTFLAIIQSMGRFHRLSSSDPVRYYFNGQEVHKARALVAKIEEIRATIPIGMPLEEYLQRAYKQEDLEKELANLDMSCVDWSDENA